VRCFKLVLSYDGTAYAGWQVQNNANTIQAELEQAIHNVTGESLRTVASGRTDAGVHALGQVVSFASATQLDADVLRRAINANLPRDIVVLEVRDAPHGFHANRDAIRKRYRYVIQDGEPHDVFARAYAWQCVQRLDVAAMQEAATVLLGQHDFSSFEASGAERATSIRTIMDLTVQRHADVFRDRIDIEVQADGFLYNMVRNIVGTLVEVGRGKRTSSWLAEVLAAKNRKVAGATAPAQGLFLIQVDYAMHECS
jgi:tRNA pseudouridine38-40 synthase